MTTTPGLLRILVVEDDHSVAESTAAILRLYCYNVRVAHSAEEAISITELFAPNAVVSDVMLPGMSGFDLAEYLAEHCPNCKVLLVSGAPPLVLPPRQGQRGYTVLPKPVMPAELLDFVDACTGTAKACAPSE